MTLSLCLLAAIAISAVGALIYTTTRKEQPEPLGPTLIGRLVVVHMGDADPSVRGLLMTDLQAAVKNEWLVLDQAEYLYSAREQPTKAPAAVRLPVAKITSIQDMPATEAG